MFEKRLFSLVPQATPYIVASVLFKWIALMANITVMWMLARILGGIVTNGLSRRARRRCPRTGGLAARRRHHRARRLHLPGPTRLATRPRSRPSAARRSLVYDKLTALGPSYTETVPTAEAVQLSVEGASAAPGVLWRLSAAALLCRPGTHHAVRAARRPSGTSRRAAARMRPGHPHLHHDGHAQRKKRSVPSIGAATSIWAACSCRRALQGLTTLKVYQADRDWHKRINAESERFRTATMRLLVMQLRSICVMDGVVKMGAALGIIVAALQLATGKIGFEAAFLIVFLSQEFFLPMRRLGIAVPHGYERHGHLAPHVSHVGRQRLTIVAALSARGQRELCIRRPHGAG